MSLQPISSRLLQRKNRARRWGLLLAVLVNLWFMDAFSTIQMLSDGEGLVSQLF
jgi:hypothetical protein